jgi:hypothetical protein
MALGLGLYHVSTVRVGGLSRLLGYTQLHVPLPHMIIGNARDDGGGGERMGRSLRAFIITNHVYSRLFFALLRQDLINNPYLPNEWIAISTNPRLHTTPHDAVA